jgi:hypothetical protein
MRKFVRWLCDVFSPTDNKFSSAKSCTATEQEPGFAVAVSVPLSDMIITYKSPFNGGTDFISETSNHRIRCHYVL